MLPSPVSVKSEKPESGAPGSWRRSRERSSGNARSSTRPAPPSYRRGRKGHWPAGHQPNCSCASMRPARAGPERLAVPESRRLAQRASMRLPPSDPILARTARAVKPCYARNRAQRVSTGAWRCHSSVEYRCGVRTGGCEEMAYIKGFGGWGARRPRSQERITQHSTRL